MKYLFQVSMGRVIGKTVSHDGDVAHKFVFGLPVDCRAVMELRKGVCNFATRIFVKSVQGLFNTRTESILHILYRVRKNRTDITYTSTSSVSVCRF